MVEDEHISKLKLNWSTMEFHKFFVVHFLVWCIIVLSRTCLSIRVRTLHHATPTRHYLKFGLINVHSANDKIDNILPLRHDRDLDVLLLCETWHDSDSVCIHRLHADGMRVIERA